MGGFVRDLLLGLANFDLDLAGGRRTPSGFCPVAAVLLGASLNVHEEFGTAT